MPNAVSTVSTVWQTTKLETASTELEAAQSAVSELTSTLEVVTEERDAAREKEEEYFLLNQENSEELMRIQEG